MKKIIVINHEDMVSNMIANDPRLRETIRIWENDDVDMVIYWGQSETAKIIEFLYKGLPVVVSNIAMYADIPDNAIIKISEGNAEEGIRQILNILIDFPEAIAAVGRRAAKYNCAISNLRKLLTQQGKLMDSVESEIQSLYGDHSLRAEWN